MRSVKVESVTTQKWRDLVECSPVATLLVRGGQHATDAGLITYCNAAARTRLLLRSSDECPSQSIFDLVDSTDHSLVRGLLAMQGDAAAPIELDITVVVEPGSSHGGALQRAQFALHLQAFGDESFIAQLVSSDGWRAADDALTEQHRFRAALMELSDLAHATEDDDKFYQRLLERAVDVVPGAQGGSVQLGVDGTTHFRFVGSVGYDLAGLQQHVLDRSDFFRDAIDPRAQIVREFVNEGRSPEIVEWLETVGRLSEIVVNVSAPVVVGGSPIAFLSLDNFEDPSAMTDTSVEMTTVLSRLIGDLWLRRRLETQLRDEREAFRHQALHDPLTGVANRRSLDQTVRQLVMAKRKSAAPTAVLFVDLDDFKGVNDRLGHEMGDMLLISVANGLKLVAGDTALVGRWGGDEFLVVPSDILSPQDAMKLGSEILERFETEVELDGAKYRTRLSVGIGWSDDSATEGTHLVRAADQALYQAKAAGKGTVRLCNA